MPLCQLAELMALKAKYKEVTGEDYAPPAQVRVAGLLEPGAEICASRNLLCAGEEVEGAGEEAKGASCPTATEDDGGQRGSEQEVSSLCCRAGLGPRTD